MIFLRLNHTGRSSNNINYQRKPKKSEQAKVNAANKKYSHHLGAGEYKKAIKNGRRCSRTLWTEATGRRLGIGRIDPSDGYLLMA